MKLLCNSVLCLCLLLLITGIPSLQAGWVDDGAVICSATGMQYDAQLASDGAGGAIITWEDGRIFPYNIYAQRIDPSGTVLWTANGVPICTASDMQEAPHITSDGTGGAIIVWEDERGIDVDLYAQKVDANGAVQWTVNGIWICTETGLQDKPQIASDGAGGAIITWQDDRGGSRDIYAQRLDDSGTAQWIMNGISICTATGMQNLPQIIFDGTGRAIITWEDERSVGTLSDIYAQAINVSGTVLWAVDGITICTESGNQYNPKIISDGLGGAIITWDDNRGVHRDIYAQRINARGEEQWVADGVAICTASTHQYVPQIISDGSGGAIITWQDDRNGNQDIYAQRIDVNGNIRWTANGVPVTIAVEFQGSPHIASDGVGGAIITWMDYRSGYWKLYAQRIDSNGTLQWGSDGVPICIAIAGQTSAAVIPDNESGAIITWQDNRNGDYNIYAQRIDQNGYRYPAPTILAVRDVPGDEGGFVNIAWQASMLDPPPYRMISHYTIWRAINPTRAAFLIHNGAYLIRSIPDVTLEMSTTVVRMDQLIEGTFYWELIDSHEAYHRHTYAKVVPTLFDSTAVCSEFHYFQILAHAESSDEYWLSAPDSAYSVDNLSPSQPQGLVGQVIQVPEGLLLSWLQNLESDLSNYAVYRELTEDFIPSPGNLISSPGDTIFFDVDWRWEIGYYYKVSAKDIHGNESPYALLRPEDLTGEEIPEIPLATYLDQNFPNPFNPMTTIRFGLKEPAYVSLRIYDAAGRLVRILVKERLEADRYEITWYGRDGSGRAVSSGIYFYSLKAGSFTETKKMVLLR